MRAAAAGISASPTMFGISDASAGCSKARPAPKTVTIA
jgi:hypothetical protein